MWTVDRLRDVMSGTVDDPATTLRTADKKGLSAVTFAAIQAAMTADRLTSLLDPKAVTDKENEDPVAELLTAIREVLAGQAVILRRLDAIERRFDSRQPGSARP